MLIVLMAFLIITSIVLLIIRRNKESFFLLGMCFSLATELTGILIYIAKKGGISRQIQEFLFFSLDIKRSIQYLLITLDNLGLIISFGRYLFPVFFLLLSMHYSMIPWIRKNRWLDGIILILPILSIIIYHPILFRLLTHNNPIVQLIIVKFSLTWIRAYVIFAIILLAFEYFAITMKFYRRYFIQITIFMISMAVLYLLYSSQDPAQVYQFYQNDFVWKQGFYYMNPMLSIQTYITIVVVNLICGVLGFTSLLNYTQMNFASNKEDIIMQRKFDTASVGVSVFVHSIKNQLLANRVIHKRIKQLYEQDSLDTQKLKEYVETLTELNEVVLTRIEELYSSVKSKSIFLVPITVDELVKDSIERFHRKYPDNEVQVEQKVDGYVLADKIQICEAICNLLTNAQEAVKEAFQGEGGVVSLGIYNERLYTVIKVSDNGIGMDKHVMKKMFEPFYTNKNSNYNWGMGLYYVRAITKGHFGSLRYESIVGKGTSFYLLLPKLMQ